MRLIDSSLYLSLLDNEHFQYNYNKGSIAAFCDCCVTLGNLIRDSLAWSKNCQYYLRKIDCTDPKKETRATNARSWQILDVFKMSLLEALQAKKRALNHTETVDSSKVDLTGGLGGSDKDFEKYQDKVLDYNIEEWLEELNDLTFETKFVPISFEQAQALQRAYEEQVLNNQELSPETKQQLSPLVSAIEVN